LLRNSFNKILDGYKV